MVRDGNTIVLFSNGPSETFRIGWILGEILKDGDCVALTGELGAGKTCLTQGIAKGLGVPDSYAVTSPTFTLLNEYPGKRIRPVPSGCLSSNRIRRSYGNGL